MIEGNPFREEIDEAGRLAKVDWSLNMVLDGSGNLVYAAAGNQQESFLKCVKVAEKIYVRDVERRFSSAVVFADPLDIDFYQATKALEHAAPAVEEGGTIVLVASCKQGIGSGEFQKYLEMSREEIQRQVESANFGNLVPAIVALRFKEIIETRKLLLLSEESIKAPGVIPGRNALEILEQLRGDTLILDKGGFTVPRIR